MSDDEYAYDNYEDDIVTNELKDEAKAFERAGVAGFDCSIYTDLKQNKKFLNRIEAFCKNTTAIILEIITNANPPILVKEDLNIILENIKNVNKPEFKNPTAFVLGYYVANDSTKEINMKKFEKVQNILYNNYGDDNEYKVSDNTVTEVDIVRYGRLWLTINKKR
jgi:hypothetical protein